MGNIMTTISPYLVLIIVGGVTLFMIMRGPWKWPQIIAGMLLMGAFYGNYPTLPAAVNSGLTSIVHSFTK